MDFHKLTRKELQFLCKKNNIPANRTNAMMANALQSMSTVKGIEEMPLFGGNLKKYSPANGRKPFTIGLDHSRQTSVRKYCGKPIRNITAMPPDALLINLEDSPARIITGSKEREEYGQQAITPARGRNETQRPTLLPPDALLIYIEDTPVPRSIMGSKQGKEYEAQVSTQVRGGNETQFLTMMPPNDLLIHFKGSPVCKSVTGSKEEVQYEAQVNTPTRGNSDAQHSKILFKVSSPVDSVRKSMENLAGKVTEMKKKNSDKYDHLRRRENVQTTELNAIAKALFYVKEKQLKECVVTTECQGIADAFRTPSSWPYITLENFSFFGILYDLSKKLEVEVVCMSRESNYDVDHNIAYVKEKTLEEKTSGLAKPTTREKSIKSSILESILKFSVSRSARFNLEPSSKELNLVTKSKNKNTESAMDEADTADIIHMGFDSYDEGALFLSPQVFKTEEVSPAEDINTPQLEINDKESVQSERSVCLN